MSGAAHGAGVPDADDRVAVLVDALLEQREAPAGREGVVLQRLAIVRAAQQRVDAGA